MPMLRTTSSTPSSPRRRGRQQPSPDEDGKIDRENCDSPHDSDVVISGVIDAFAERMVLHARCHLAEKGTDLPQLTTLRAAVLIVSQRNIPHKRDGQKQALTKSWQYVHCIALGRMVRVRLAREPHERRLFDNLIINTPLCDTGRLTPTARHSLLIADG